MKNLFGLSNDRQTISVTSDSKQELIDLALKFSKDEKFVFFLVTDLLINKSLAIIYEGKVWR